MPVGGGKGKSGPSGSSGLTPRQQATVASLQKTIKPQPKQGKRPPDGPGGRKTPPGLSPTAGRADATLRRQAKAKGDTQPQYTMTPAEWNTAHPGATAEQKKQFRDAYDTIGRVLESRGYAPAGSSDLNGGPSASQRDEASNHIQSQTRVGGTKGSTEMVDRSAAVKRSWDTRRSLYGSSGRKESSSGH